MDKKDKGEIAYKVVEKKTRNGTNWALFKNILEYCGDGRVKLAYIQFKREHKEWFPRYRKGSIVEMAEGSVGILTFCDKHTAGRFIDREVGNQGNLKIIKVRGIGRIPTPKLILAGLGTNIRRITMSLERANEWKVLRSPPPGVVCYKKVEVLE